MFRGQLCAKVYTVTLPAKRNFLSEFYRFKLRDCRTLVLHPQMQQDFQHFILLNYLPPPSRTTILCILQFIAKEALLISLSIYISVSLYLYLGYISFVNL